jgi:AraC-like DNA-binding protein
MESPGMRHMGGTSTSSVGRSRIMLITPSRIAYRGLFGKPGVRAFGAWIIYLALEQPFQISVDGDSARSERIALVPPYVPHRVATVDRELVEVLIEAETVEDISALQHLIETPKRREGAIMRICDGFDHPLGRPEDFDRHFFGRDLPARTLDARVDHAISHINAHCAASVTAEDCAAQVGLSFSRFTHLFSREVQTTFRRFRAWKRARGLMTMVGGGPSLVNVALDAGYADSTHFCHAIRQFYGYTPRDIFAGSRWLAVISQWPSSVAA